MYQLLYLCLIGTVSPFIHCCVYVISVALNDLSFIRIYRSWKDDSNLRAHWLV